MLDESYSRICSFNLPQEIGSLVGTIIINENDLVRNPHLIQYCFNLLVEGFEGAGFIMGGIAEERTGESTTIF
jgi:hypothetical protein